MTRRRGPAVAAGLAALVTLVALVVGLPVLLYRLGGSPLPRHVPGLTEVRHDLLHRDSASVVLAAVRDVSWIAWAAFTIAVLAEAQAMLRRRTAPRLFLGGVQGAAGRLVALAALTFTSAPVGTLLSTPQPAAVMTVVPRADVMALPLAGMTPPRADPTLLPPEDATAAKPAAQGMSMGFFQLVTVRPGDCLWTIAQHYLGNGDRYQEIVALNLRHDMGQGQVFTDAAVIWPGWVLHLPAQSASQAGTQDSAPAGATHSGHSTGDRHYGHPHSGAAAHHGHASPGIIASPPAATTTAPSPAAAEQASAETSTLTPAQSTELPLFVAFGTGVLAGGAAVSLAKLRHRQRQIRRRGRRIPLPASAPVAEAEQRLNITASQEPVSALRGVLGNLGAALVAAGQQIPPITAVQLEPDFLDLLLAAPAADPPPEPFTVPGGRQGMTWRMWLADALTEAPAEAADLLPGLLTIGTADGGYVLLDLEHLQVTTVAGPASMTAAVLRSAAAELATGQLAGWYDLILVGFPELSVLGGRGTCCGSLDAGLDLLAAKAVALRRRLGAAPLADVRYHRLAEPGDEDWALTLLVSAVAPTAGQLALLSDLAADPGGIAALVAGGTAPPGGHRPPASIDLAAGPVGSEAIVARVWPLQLEARARPLDDADYEALTSLFAVAMEESDVSPADPPYDSWAWPPDLVSLDDKPAHPGSGSALDDLDLASVAYAADPASDSADPARTYSADPTWTDSADPAWTDSADPAWTYSADPAWTDSADPAWTDSADHASPDAADPASAASAAPAWSDRAAPGLHTQPAAWLHDGEPAPTPGGPDPDQQSLRIGVLGTFTINGQPGALLPAQSQLVLALALNGITGLSNQQLCYLLGADPDRPKQSDSLRQLIVRTRRQLGPAPDGREWVEHLGGGQYALHPAARFDWTDFEALTTEGLRSRDAQQLGRALRLIRGRPFTGCYYWWLDLAMTETIRAQIVDAADVLAALELAAGNPATAARAARTGLAGDAGAEQLWRALMRAEHAAGNLTGVREAWNRCLDAIGEIAPDGEPHPGTSALYRELTGTAPARPAWAAG